MSSLRHGCTAELADLYYGMAVLRLICVVAGGRTAARDRQFP